MYDRLAQCKFSAPLCSSERIHKESQTAGTGRVNVSKLRISDVVIPKQNLGVPQQISGGDQQISGED